MNILHLYNHHNYIIINKSIFSTYLDKLLNILEYMHPVEVNVIIINSNEIKILNNKHRFINKPTDVLSFPLNMDEKIIKGCGFNLLGDIYMCDSILNKNRLKTGRSIQNEYSYMFLHSVLHLLGFDHVKKVDEKIMDDYITLTLTTK